MDYPFVEGEKYFTPKQQKHIDEFIAVLPEPKKVYTNEKGERRKVIIVRLPRGCKTYLTAYFLANDGKTYYHTPTAGHDEPWGVMYYEDADAGVGASCTSMEWLKWLGASYTVDDAAVPMSAQDAKITQYSESKRRAIASGAVPKVTPEEFEKHKMEKPKEPEWRPVVPKKKS